MEMLKCGICGKLYPKGSVCCGAGIKNEIYIEEDTSEHEMNR